LSDSPWSAEARVLFDPARVFRDAARDGSRRGSWWRRPLALLFAFGCLVSILASGRLTARLILDGAVSFAFVAAIEIAAFAMARSTGGRRAPVASPPASFSRDVDLFLVGNAPWFLWMVLVGAIFGAVPPRALGPWMSPALLGSLIPTVWSAWIDFHFFREVLQRSPSGARRAVLVNRAIGWVAAFGIFLGIAIWSYLPGIAAWVGR
jgi:hypothetical protein